MATSSPRFIAPTLAVVNAHGWRQYIVSRKREKVAALAQEGERLLSASLIGGIQSVRVGFIRLKALGLGRSGVEVEHVLALAIWEPRGPAHDLPMLQVLHLTSCADATSYAYPAAFAIAWNYVVESCYMLEGARLLLYHDAAIIPNGKRRSDRLGQAA